MYSIKKKEIEYKIVRQYNWGVNIKSVSFYKAIKIKLRNLVALNQIANIVKINKIDIVFTNTLLPNLAAEIAFRKKLPHVWWVHEFGEADFGFKIGWGNMAEGFNYIQKCSKLIIANSNAVLKYLKTEMPQSKIEKIYQPVSWENEFVEPTKKDTYLMFGQIIESKGHLLVIEAIKQLKDKNISIKLNILGPSENIIYLNTLKCKIIDYELSDCITIKVGFFRKEKIMPAYKALIVASNAEAFGRVIVEANKAGIKAIVKNGGGASELINITNGYLFNNIRDLIGLLSNYDNFSDKNIVKFNYIETEEILKLKKILYSI